MKCGFGSAAPLAWACTGGAAALAWWAVRGGGVDVELAQLGLYAGDAVDAIAHRVHWAVADGRVLAHLAVFIQQAHAGLFGFGDF